MGGNQTKVRLKYSRDNWKSKAREKSLLIKSQKKQIAELQKSRNYWKIRYQELKVANTSSSLALVVDLAKRSSSQSQATSSQR